MTNLKDKLRVPCKIAMGLLLGAILVFTFNGVRNKLYLNICQQRAKSVNALLEESSEYIGVKATSLRQTSKASFGPIRIPVKEYYVYIYGDVESVKQRDAAISLIRKKFDYANLLFQIDIKG